MFSMIKQQQLGRAVRAMMKMMRNRVLAHQTSRVQSVSGWPRTKSTDNQKKGMPRR